MTNYRRHFVPGGSYFFTVVAADRPQGLLTKHMGLLRKSFKTVMEEKPFVIDAMVVLPDHLHCLWTLPPEDKDYSTRWKNIKALFSKGLQKTEARSESRISKGERGIWQRRYWEHAIRDDEDYARHVDYIHYNPIKHGYVEKLIDWPHSSFHRYVKAGIYTSDWAASSGIEDLDFE
ncbi:transposase [Methylococcus sp. EFPC2]|uniref:REP-associated tyrosine transposase n=1 Tax=Methylococcus sp. EFPC2 TaxID=2812648 RepID=UPI001968764A|nr:transposase [Methylococcus sp. EFPC2]QSA97578.1 transposase [Methylococcus sp. EFPC2]